MIHAKVVQKLARTLIFDLNSFRSWRIHATFLKHKASKPCIISYWIPKHQAALPFFYSPTRRGNTLGSAESNR